MRRDANGPPVSPQKIAHRRAASGPSQNFIFFFADFGEKRFFLTSCASAVNPAFLLLVAASPQQAPTAREFFSSVRRRRAVAPPPFSRWFPVLVRSPVRLPNSAF